MVVPRVAAAATPRRAPPTTARTAFASFRPISTSRRAPGVLAPVVLAIPADLAVGFTRSAGSFGEVAAADATN